MRRQARKKSITRKLSTTKNIDKLERANILAKSLIPKVDALLHSQSYDEGSIGKYLNGLLKCDKELSSKFTQLLKETKQRLQKEFEEL